MQNYPLSATGAGDRNGCLLLHPDDKPSTQGNRRTSHSLKQFQVIAFPSILDAKWRTWNNRFLSIKIFFILLDKQKRTLAQSAQKRLGSSKMKKRKTYLSSLIASSTFWHTSKFASAWEAKCQPRFRVLPLICGIYMQLLKPNSILAQYATIQTLSFVQRDVWYQQDLWDREPQVPVPAAKVASLLALDQEEKGMDKINRQGAVTLTRRFHSVSQGIEQSQNVSETKRAKSLLLCRLCFSHRQL